MSVAGVTVPPPYLQQLHAWRIAITGFDVQHPTPPQKKNTTITKTEAQLPHPVYPHPSSQETQLPQAPQIIYVTPSCAWSPYAHTERKLSSRVKGN